MRPIPLSAIIVVALLGAASMASADGIVTGATTVQSGGAYYGGRPEGTEYVDLPYNLSTDYYERPHTTHNRRHSAYKYARPSCCTSSPVYYYSPFVGQCDPYHNWFYYNSPYYRPTNWATPGYELGGR